jgi:hypothetical protein
MKFFLIFPVVLLAACNNFSENNTTPLTAPEDSKTQKVTLEGGLGIVSVSLPARYDTTFSWVHYSDCGKPCEKRKYRFQPKILPVYPESGFVYKTLNDSVEQFTIVHNPYIPVEDSDKTDNQSFITFFHDHKKFEITHNPALREIKWDTMEKIGDRYFSIIIIDKYDSAKAQYSKRLLSTTTLRRGTIDFNFDLLSKQKDSLTEKFIDNAKYYLRTVRIESGNK